MKKLKYLLVVAILICLTGCGETKKSFDPSKVEEFLNKEGFKTYFSYKGNNYDKDYKCYSYDYSKQEKCDREIEFWDFFAIDSIKDEKHIDVYTSLDENDNIEQITVHYERMNGDSKYDYSSYVISNDGKEEYYSTAKNYDLCNYIIKTEELKDHDDCSEKDKIDQKKVKDMYDDLLNQYGLSYQDIFDYYEWYSNEYVMPYFKASKEDAKKDLSYEQVLDTIEKDEYKTIKLSSDKTQVIIAEKYLNYKIYISPETDNVEGYIVFTADKNEQVGIVVTDKDDIIYGVTEDCFYNIEEEKTKDGGTCSSSDIEKIETQKREYDYYIGTLRLKLSELRSFGKEYIKKNS